MDYTTWPTVGSQADELAHLPIRSLYHAFQGMADPRKAKGKRYELALLLTFIVLAKLARGTSLSGATHWVRLRAPWLKAQLGLSPARMPCQNTYRTVLGILDGEEVTLALAPVFTR